MLDFDIENGMLIFSIKDKLQNSLGYLLFCNNNKENITIEIENLKRDIAFVKTMSEIDREDLISVIRSSENEEDANKNITEKFSMDARFASRITSLKLAKFTDIEMWSKASVRLTKYLAFLESIS